MGAIVPLAVLLVLVLAAALLKPKDRGGGYDPYFAQLNQALKDARIGTARILIDRDRLDHNLSVILAHIPGPQAYRIVVKSIPSIELIRAIRARVATNKFMVVHRPFLKVLLDAFEPGIDILLGKPIPLFGLQEFYREIPPEARGRAQAEIQWLVDTRARLAEYQACAQELGLKLRINIEIDIGLHRGGVASLEELDGLLADIRSDPQHLVFSGFMGYEGHVPHAPAILTPARSAALKEFAENLSVYRGFVEHVRQRHPDLFSPSLTFNSGGSGTYSLFGDYPFITDIGIGGAVLRPATYPGHFLYDLQPAEFIAAPVLKKRPGTCIPFIESLGGVLAWWDPNSQVTFEIYGGGWAARFAAPQGIQIQALTADPPNQNLVPNQTTLTGSRRMALEIGDFVFHDPYQSDAMFQFEDILLVHSGRVDGCWPVFDRRY